MKALVECFEAWLKSGPSDVGAYKVLAALTGETKKRAHSDDPAQREFDALAIAEVCKPDEFGQADFDQAKRWLDRQDVLTWAEARRAGIEDYFRRAGFGQALRPKKRSSGGRHRAQWFLEPYDIEPAPVEADEASLSSNALCDEGKVVYEFTPPGAIRLNWLGRPWFRSGRFETRSPIGMFWLASVLMAFAVLCLVVLAIWAMTVERRPVLLGDLAILLLMVAGAYGFWHFFIRPSVLLVEDRIRPAPEALLAWSESPAQIEFAKEGGRRVVQIVRYSAKCPVCAGDLELVPGEGIHLRRLIGRCNESPREHAYTFDRVTRRGRRVD